MRMRPALVGLCFFVRLFFFLNISFVIFACKKNAYILEKGGG